MLIFRTYLGVCFSFLLILSLPTLSQGEPEKARKRSFRPIAPVRHIPIKQNVNDGMTQMKSQSVKVTIPPPPIPDTATSLFPDDSVPVVNLPPESFEEVDLTDSEFKESTDLPPTEGESASGPTLNELREEAHKLATQGLTYSFGADDPDSGGLDCSGAMQYLLKKIGVDDVPRTSYDQYDWLKKNKTLDDVYGKSASKKLFKKLSPGDLIFWGGTWKSGHRVSHVMLYMGYDPKEDKHWVFGARGKSSKGEFGNGVDLFELEPDRGRLIAHGKIPGLKY